MPCYFSFILIDIKFNFIVVKIFYKILIFCCIYYNRHLSFITSHLKLVLQLLMWNVRPLKSYIHIHNVCIDGAVYFKSTYIINLIIQCYNFSIKPSIFLKEIKKKNAVFQFINSSHFWWFSFLLRDLYFHLKNFTSFHFGVKNSFKHFL